jgi:hypothetical protein
MVSWADERMGVVALDEVPAERLAAEPEPPGARSGLRRAGALAAIGGVALVETAWLGLLAYLLLSLLL